MKHAALWLFALLVACQSIPEPERPAPTPAPAPAQTKGGGYYLDDGPGENIPPDLDRIADATPRAEAPHRFANRPYSVMGRDYVPVSSAEGFRQRGMASWYGRRFHGQKTSSGEIYDMYAMTAAHPTLPIPSYVRVTSVSNGRSVVVRINDRGPFLHDRIIDLSYAAAHRLGYIQKGSTLVEVETALPDAADAPGLYVQLGAFSARANAEALRNRIAQEAPELADLLNIVAGDNLFRLVLGPYKSREEADRAGAQAGSRFDLQPRVITR